MPSDKYWPEATFCETVANRIFDTPLPDETAASRVKQVGLMVLLRLMYNRKVETTVSNIVEASGLSRPAIFVIVKPLTDRGMLIEETVLNVEGRGRATRFTIDAKLVGR